MSGIVIGLIGLGTVGTGVVRLLSDRKQVRLKTVAVRDLSKHRDISLPGKITDRVADIIEDPEIDVVIEVAGGVDEVYNYVVAAIKSGKHVVTANKKLLAQKGPELFSLARARGVSISFEASVAGGIPLISTLLRGLRANKIDSFAGILNGTTNFILSQMHASGSTYATALKEAQRFGYAESDPIYDVDGYDVAHKLSILSALSFGQFVNPDDIYREGIRSISLDDIALAKSLGYVIKLLGFGLPTKNGKLDLRVQPLLIPQGHPLYAVDGADNAIVLCGSAVGQISLRGPGAGQEPTASAVVGDVLNLVHAINPPQIETFFQPEIDTRWAELSKSSSAYFINILRIAINVHDAQTIAAISSILVLGLEAQSIETASDDGGYPLLTIETAPLADQTIDRVLAKVPNIAVLNRLKVIPRRLTKAPPTKADNTRITGAYRTLMPIYPI